MKDKVCENCEHFKRAAYYGGADYCTRFPEWMEISSACWHWCGEYSEVE